MKMNYQMPVEDYYSDPIPRYVGIKASKEQRTFRRESTDFGVTKILEGNVGRYWNLVYSEICSKADCRTYIGSSVREVTKHLVEENAIKTPEGEILSPNGLPLDKNFYVDPESQLLLSA